MRRREVITLFGGAAVASAVQLYTFASPRVGLLDFAATVDKAAGVPRRRVHTEGFAFA